MKTLKSQRLHIGFFGRVNVGKSSLINAITGQSVSIVSEIEGTTTDIVEKSIELFPIGPVVLLDTAGLDDCSNLGNKRIKKTLSSLNRIDIGIIVTDSSELGDIENNLIKEFNLLNIPFIVIVNKIDLIKNSNNNYSKNLTVKNQYLFLSAHKTQNITELFITELLKILPADFINSNTIIGDKLNKSDIVILVTPIDKEAPKGRLILPQVQTIRDILDNNCISVVCEPNNIKFILENLKIKPKLVITDSQAFNEVDKIVPKDIYLTSFSILFAKLKGDLNTFVHGAYTIKHLKENDKILILESCSHHAIDDDIARVKIPKLLEKKCNCKFNFDYKTGHDFPDISTYKLIIHCGACMTNRKEVLSRIIHAQNKNIPITNFGITIAYCLNILDRAIELF